MERERSYFIRDLIVKILLVLLFKVINVKKVCHKIEINDFNSS